MAHTLPPWTTKYKMVTIFGQIDTGELAARLGSIVTFDRRGNVVFMDDFEAAVLHWSSLSFGDGDDISLITDYVRNGAQSVKLTPGSGDTGYATIGRSIPLPVATRLGLETSFTVHADLTTISVIFSIYTGLKRHHITIVYWPIKKELTYKKLGGADQPFVTDLNLYKSAGMFHTLKVVVDYATGKYVRCILDDKTYDMSDYSYNITTETTERARCSFSISVLNSKAGNPSIYVDDVIFTQNEP